MSRFWKIILVLFFAFLIVEIVLFAPKTLDVRTPSYDSFEDLETANKGRVQQKLQGFQLIESKNEKKEWEVWGEEAVSYRDDESWRIQKIKIKFFGSKGDYYLVLGDKGIVHPSKDIRIEGNVKIYTMNGYKFLTDSLVYNSKMKTLTTDSEVKMFGPKENGRPNIKIKGKGLLADLNNSEVRILESVTAEKKYKNELVKISSGQVQLSGLSYMSKFINKVVIDSDSLRITGSVAGVGLSPKSGEINTILVEGNVKVSDSEKWATADQLEADFLKNKFIFKGSPRVVQNEDELTGDEIIFLDGGKKVKVLRARVRVNKDQLEK